MSAAKIKTQRAWAWYDCAGDLVEASPYPEAREETPVLVVPLANVKGCKHEPADRCTAGDFEFCANCSRYRTASMITGRWMAWKLPRVLRAGR